MQLKDLDFNQIIIVLLFLGFLITLQQLIKKNKFNLQRKFNNRKRINLVDEFGLSPGERIRLLRVDNKEYLYFYSKGSSPVICPHEIDRDSRLGNIKPQKVGKADGTKIENSALDRPSNKKPSILSEAISAARKMNPQLGFKK
mgnify:CR=1 FL=1